MYKYRKGIKTHRSVLLKVPKNWYLCRFYYNVYFLCGCETLSVTVREGCVLMAFENKVLGEGG